MGQLERAASATGAAGRDGRVRTARLFRWQPECDRPRSRCGQRLAVQYFDDKLDFFAHVAEQASVTIYTAMAPYLTPAPPGRSFLDHLGDLVDIWMDYMGNHPLERGVTAATTLEVNPEIRRAVREPVHRLYAQGLRPLLASADDDLDIDALVSMLVLLLPHLALAPFEPGLDAGVALYGTSGAQRSAIARRLLAALLPQALVTA
jgi:hypothetical protein